MAASLLIVSGILLLLIVIAPAGLAYIALRVRDSRLTVADPQLGFKTALHALHTLAVIMVLAGLSISAGDLLQGTLSDLPRVQQGRQLVEDKVDVHLGDVGDHVTLWQPRQGGHVGFPDGRFPGHVRRMPDEVGGWLLARVATA